MGDITVSGLCPMNLGTCTAEPSDSIIRELVS